MENCNVNAVGAVRIVDADTGELILSKQNAVHPRNLSYAISRSLARETNGFIFKLAFGNGGTFYNSSATLVYRSPNTTGDANLYNSTYEVQVDDAASGTPESNSVNSAAATAPSISALVVVTALLTAGEPSGQAAADNITTDSESAFTFDEIGLKTDDGSLLTHLVFSPIEKTANRAFAITYTLTINVS